jgi:hypothetical protein
LSPLFFFVRMGAEPPVTLRIGSSEPPLPVRMEAELSVTLIIGSRGFSWSELKSKFLHAPSQTTTHTHTKPASENGG